MLTNANRMQELERKVQELEERLRALEPQDSSTVRMEKTAHGFMAHADPSAPQPAEETPLVWG